MNMFRWLSDLFGFGSWTSSTDELLLEHHTVNPANGLPMVGGVDVAGNPYGADSPHDHMLSSGFDDHVVNPANGLPMVGGIGGLDVAGNPYGTDSSHDHLTSTGIGEDCSFGEGSLFNDQWGTGPGSGFD